MNQQERLAAQKLAVRVIGRVASGGEFVRYQVLSKYDPKFRRVANLVRANLKGG